MAWNYYNGSGHTSWRTGEFIYKPMNAAYCADCAPDHLPGWNARARRGAEHHETEFKCGPWIIGLPCSHCGKPL